MTDLAHLADIVDEAARTAQAIPQLTLAAPLTVEEAYAVQALAVARRCARGERLAGLKMGLTSRAKMAQVNVHDVIWGRLTDAMRVEEGGTIAIDRYVHPRVEPELAVLLRAPLAGRVSPAEAAAAVDGFAPAMEIIDSRYRDFKFALADVIADNSSSSGFVVGGWHRPDTDISNLGMVLEVDGRPAQVGSSAAILGHPLRSLVAAARLAGEAGLRLEAGWIVLLGAATAAVPLARGMHVRSTVATLGSVAFSVGG